MRLEGAGYEEIARAGGGIVSSVRATRAADEATLLAAALPRVDALLAEGVTTLEIKSGYGLDRESELKMLRVARADRRGAAGAGGDELARRPRAAAGVPRRPRRLPPRRGDRRDGRRPCRRADRRRRRLLRGHRLQPRRDRAGLRARGDARPAGQAARRAALRPRRRGARGAARRAVGRPSGMARAGRDRRDGRSRHRRGAAPRRLLHAARDQGCRRSRACATPACRSRWRPTATPAPRR